METIRFYREFCQQCKKQRKKISSLSDFLLALRSEKLIIFIDTNASLGIVATIEQINKGLSVGSDFIYSESEAINYLYAWLLLWVRVENDSHQTTNTGIKSYTISKLYTGPPGIKHLFSISIALRRVLFASDIL